MHDDGEISSVYRFGDACFSCFFQCFCTRSTGLKVPSTKKDAVTNGSTNPFALELQYHSIQVEIIWVHQKATGIKNSGTKKCYT